MKINLITPCAAARNASGARAKTRATASSLLVIVALAVAGCGSGGKAASCYDDATGQPCGVTTPPA
jgi:hypothetical protein